MTAVLPYVLLIIIFISTVMQPGAGSGLLYYVTPDFRKLLDVQVCGCCRRFPWTELSSRNPGRKDLCKILVEGLCRRFLGVELCIANLGEDLCNRIPGPRAL